MQTMEALLAYERSADKRNDDLIHIHERSILESSAYGCVRARPVALQFTGQWIWGSPSIRDEMRCGRYRSRHDVSERSTP
jgi:hypothetical protein